MSVITLPTAFAASYNNFERFPLKVVLKETYGSSYLKNLQERLRERAIHLLVTDDRTFIPVRDISSDGEVQKNNISSNKDLKEWLGDLSTQDPLDATRHVGPIASKRDPRCRFVFLVADTVVDPLKITLSGLKRLFAYHQVSPTFLDFLDVYGSPFAEDRELRFCGFRSEVYLQNPEPGMIIPELNRSGRHYQISYNMKTVVLKEPNKDSSKTSTWKIRQEVLHHQFDTGTGIQLWIFGDPHCALKERMGELFYDRRNYSHKFETISRSFATSLDVHLEVARWSMGGWRQHILYLEAAVEGLDSEIISKRDFVTTSHLELGQLHFVQACEDKTHESIMALESNADNSDSICAFYTNLVEDEDFPESERSPCRQSLKKFCLRIREIVYDLRMQIKRAQVLAKKIADRKIIFIQMLQVQAAARAEGLSSTMWRQAEKTSQDAVSMRVITVITLLYLPPTFISTVFSTDIVKYQGDDGSTNITIFSALALQRWLQSALPLTALTFLATFAWIWYEARNAKKRAASLEMEFPDVFRRANRCSTSL